MSNFTITNPTNFLGIIVEGNNATGGAYSFVLLIVFMLVNYGGLSRFGDRIAIPITLFNAIIISILMTGSGLFAGISYTLMILGLLGGSLLWSYFTKP